GRIPGAGSRSHQRFGEPEHTLTPDLCVWKHMAQLILIQQADLLKQRITFLLTRPRHQAPDRKVPQQTQLKCARQPVHERSEEVRLDWEPLIWRLDVVALAHALAFGGEPALIFVITEVLDHRVAIHNVKRVILKGETPPVGDQPDDTGSA